MLILVSQFEYTQDGTDRQTDTRPMLYAYRRCGRGQRSDLSILLHDQQAVLP